MPALRLEHLNRVYEGPKGERIPAIQDLSLEVGEGELLTIVGPSGSGKTTLLRLVAGLEQPDSGTISASGRILNEVPAKDREIAMLHQSAALYHHMTAGENIQFGLHVRKVPSAEARTRVSEAVDVMGLAPCVHRRPGELSGGERQRVALARALVLRPRFFLLDEPLSQLDTPLRAQLRAEILRLQRHTKAAMLYVTHDQAEAVVLGARMAVLNHGRLEQAGLPADIYSAPANLFVASFFGSPGMNLLEGSILSTENETSFVSSNQAIRLPLSLPNSIPLKNNQTVTLGVRPESLHLVQEAKALPPIEGTLLSAQRIGPEAHVRLMAGEQMLEARILSEAPIPAPGMRMRLYVDTTRACLFDTATGARIV